MCGHDSADAVGIRSQQQVPNFMSQHIPEHGMAEFSLFSDSLDAVVKDISVVADALPIHKSRPEHIAAIAGLSANRARKDLQHQMGGIDGITIAGLDFLQ